MKNLLEMKKNLSWKINSGYFLAGMLFIVGCIVGNKVRNVKTYIILLLGFFPYCLFAQTQDEINFLKENTIDISINPNNNDFEDLSPLKTILADKKIVGMGESTHGSKEFFEMKHRMFKFLVTEMGYRLFGIEANFTECRDINDYVLNGKGNAKDAIANMYFWTWNTQEVEDMVEWMREYNKTVYTD